MRTGVSSGVKTVVGGQASSLEEDPGIVSFGFLGASEQQCQCIEAWSTVEGGLVSSQENRGDAGLYSSI